MFLYPHYMFVNYDSLCSQHLIRMLHTLTTLICNCGRLCLRSLNFNSPHARSLPFQIQLDAVAHPHAMTHLNRTSRQPHAHLQPHVHVQVPYGHMHTHPAPSWPTAKLGECAQPALLVSALVGICLCLFLLSSTCVCSCWAHCQDCCSRDEIVGLIAMNALIRRSSDPVLSLGALP